MKLQNIATGAFALGGILVHTVASSPQTVHLDYATYQATLNITSNVTSFMGVRYSSPPIGNLRFQMPTPPVHAFASSPQTVHLGYATYQGTLNTTSNVTSFMGVRYASPPIGKLRFQMPTSPPTFDGVQNATTPPPACPQGGMGISSSSTSRLMKRATEIEDCLFLNVYVPGEVSADQRMPVVVWIHGGGYGFGYASMYDGVDLVKEANGGVVVVSIQYRLGLFGFLAGKDVKNHGALNAGLLDQEFALKWVQEHISSFGGDPDKVTIWGESAGAGSVLQHMIAHGGNTQPPLFRAAITSSTYLPSQYHYSDPVPEQLYSQVVEQVGCSNATNTFNCLVSADASLLETANTAISNSAFYGTFVFVPVVDGSFIVDSPMRIIKRGRLNGHALLSVTNTFEGRVAVSSSMASNMTLSEYVSQLFPAFGERQIKETVHQYTGIGLDTVVDQAIAVMGESIFICPTYALLGGFTGRSFKGEFAVPPGDHAEDVFYYFQIDPALASSPNSPTIPNGQFNASFAGSFLGVVKSLDPNVNPLYPESVTPLWAPYAHGKREMLFNVTEAGETDIRAFSTDDGLLKRCDFWKSVAKYTPQ